MTSYVERRQSSPVLYYRTNVCELKRDRQFSSSAEFLYPTRWPGSSRFERCYAVIWTVLIDDVIN